MTQFIDEQRDVYGVEPICEALQFADVDVLRRQEASDRSVCARGA